ncbi:MAG: helix-turn-helix domain-containing protein [Sulfurovum sp.]|nr:helix-turn-helix domain-containing protein [Sulfurovum sp.]
MNPIGELLVAYRKHLNVTQKELVETLSGYDEEFLHLNAVTLSRWETGVTSPSVRKKRKLIHFFLQGGCLRCVECRQITRACYENLYDKLCKIFNKHYQYIIGNLPEQNGTKSYTYKDIKEIQQARLFVEHIVDFEKASNVEGYYAYGYSEIYRWSMLPASFVRVAEHKGQHLGHFVMYKLRTKVAEDIVYGRRSEMSLKDEDFCPPFDRGTYMIHGMYGRNPKIAAELNIQAYLYFLDHMEYIDNIMVFSSRKDGAEITKDYGIKLVARGKDETYGFTWHGMISPVEDILFSDTIIKLVF